MRLESLQLYAHGDDNTGRREFRAFRLYAKNSASGQWDLLDTFAPTHPYTFEKGDSSPLRSFRLSTPVTAQEFRAEFVQGKAPDGTINGPRIVELMGIGTLTP